MTTESARFCASCGAPARAPDASFCWSCGTTLGAGTSAAPTASAAPMTDAPAVAWQPPGSYPGYQGYSVRPVAQAPSANASLVSGLIAMAGAGFAALSLLVPFQSYAGESVAVLPILAGGWSIANWFALEYLIALVITVICGAFLAAGSARANETAGALITAGLMTGAYWLSQLIFTGTYGSDASVEIGNYLGIVGAILVTTAGGLTLGVRPTR